MRVIYAVFGAAFTLAIAGALGTLLLRKLALCLNSLEARLLAIVLGSACLSAIVFALCTLGLARKSTYLLLGLLVITYAVRSGAHHLRSAPLDSSPRAWKCLVVGLFMS